MSLPGIPQPGGQDLRVGHKINLISSWELKEGFRGLTGFGNVYTNDGVNDGAGCLVELMKLRKTGRP